MSSKTFYIETFGCQMNVHDSEKVVGTLVSEGYRQVETVEEADLVLYNTCSIRDKAEQKVFNRLSDYKKYKKQGKTFGVLGCVAQQEGEKIFERAPYVSLVAGSASYRKLPEMLRALEVAELRNARLGNAGLESPVESAVESSAIDSIDSHPSKSAKGGAPSSVVVSAGKSAVKSSGQKPVADSLVRITGLDDRETDECFETEFTARTNPHRGYITIIEGCDKFCAYCVVPYTRGKERSRTSDSVLAEARQMADLGYTEIQLLGQNVNSYKDPEGKPGGKKSFAELLAAVGEVPGIRRVRFTTSHPRDFGRDIIDAIDDVPTLCDHVHLPVQSGSTRVLDAMQRLYNRDQYLERIAWMKAAKREISITTDMIVGFPGETEADFAETLSLLDEVGFDAVFAFKYSPRPNTPSLSMEDVIPDEEKARRLEVLMARQREIQIVSYKRYIGKQYEAMVEGRNEARGQFMGRTSDNKTLNFTAPAEAVLSPGMYVPVRVTASFPNSLVGELVV
jgi:tRNA-2-methylthio-N6-dimethylallyladenosine synthase